MRAVPILQVDTVAALKATRVAAGTVALTVGRGSVGDGLGALYRWDAASTAAEDLVFYNVIASSRTSAGRWVRIVAQARAWPAAPAAAQGYLTINGGVRTLFVYGTTDASGLVTAYLTETGTLAGAPIFAEVWRDTGSSRADAPTPADVIVGSRASLSADRKTLTYRFARGNPQTLGGTLSALLGVVITPLRAPAAGTPVVLKIEGR